MTRWRITLSITILMLVVMSASTACTTTTDETTTTPETVAKERIRVSGSGTSLPLLQILTDEYSATHPDVEFVYLPGLHSGGGIRGVAAGDLELGAVSRELTDEEAALGLTYVKLSDDGLVMATHPSVEIDGLTSEQIREIYRGEHVNWSTLGGNDLTITILDRNEDESAKIILRKYVLGPDLEITSKAVSLFYEPDMVEGLMSTPGSLGYFSLGYGLSEDVPVNYLSLDGVEPTVANIENGSYEMVRPLGVVAAEPMSEETKSFLEWAQSEEARTLAREQGFAPPRLEGE